MFRKTEVKAGFHSQRGGIEGSALPFPLLGHKNRKSADRRSINENTAAVCGRTMQRLPSTRSSAPINEPMCILTIRSIGP